MTLYGYTAKVFTDPEKYPELKARHERMVTELLVRKYGREPDRMQWTYSPATGWTDPDTGEEMEIPEMWALMAEVRVE